MEQRSKMKNLLGSFAEGEFWAELAKTVVTEVLRAAVLALTGSITMYITNKVSGRAIAFSGTTPASSNTDLANRAFSGSESNYGRSYDRAYAPSVSTQASSFPGFGSR